MPHLFAAPPGESVPGLRLSSSLSRAIPRTSKSKPWPHAAADDACGRSRNERKPLA
jgi:hypothetical protein